MPNLTKTLTVYEGADLTPARNRTDETIWEATELATMAFQGEAAAGSWKAHETTTLGGAHTIFVRPHNLMKLTVGSNTLWQGRVATRDAERGDTVQQNHRLHSVTTEDQNSHLRGIIVHNWERGEETDAARVQALVARYLSGNPRNSTNLNGSNFVVTGSNTITLPAQTYSGMEPFDVLQEIAEATDKTFFVSVDDELHYYGNDYTGYASSLRISEDLTDLDTATCVPIHPSTSELSREIINAQRTYWRNPEGGNERSWKDENITIQNQQDYWEGMFHDSESPTRTLAERASAARLRENDRGEGVHTVTIGKPGASPRSVVDLDGKIGTAGQPMTGDDVWRVKPGQTIQFKSSVLRPNEWPNFTTRRIRSIRWTFPAADSYFATLEIEQPKPLGPKRRGSRKPRPAPAPAPEQTPPPASSVSEIACWTWTTNTLDDTNTYDSFITRHASVHTFTGGSMAANHGDLSSSGERTQAVPVTAGTTVQAEMQFRWKWDPSTRPIYVEFWSGSSPSGLIETWTFESGSGRAVNTVYSLSATHTVPVGANYATFTFPTFHGSSIVDNMCLSTVTSPASSEPDPDAVDYGDCPHDSTHFLPSDYVLCRLNNLQDQVSSVSSGSTSSVTVPHLITGLVFPIVSHHGDVNDVDGYPENTVEALLQTMLRGGHGIEPDVLRSADGTFHAHHDLTVDRTTDGTGTFASKTDAQIAALNIDGGQGYDTTRHGTSLDVPTLDRVLDACLPYDPLLVLDLKEDVSGITPGSGHAAGATALAEWVVGNNVVQRTIIQVYNLAAAAAVKAVNTSIQVALVTWSDFDVENDADVDRLAAPHSEVSSLSFVTARAPKPVDAFPYDIAHTDERAVMQNMWDRGVRMWLTNDVRTALKYRHELIDPMSPDHVRNAGRWEPVTNGVDTFVWEGSEIVVEYVETP